MYKIVDWAKTKITSFGVFLGFTCLKQYSAICVYLENLICDQYYKHLMFQSWMDYIFEWYHFLMVAILYRHMEPLYNPWISVFYMKSGAPNENYYNIKKSSGFIGYYPKRTSIPLSPSVTSLLDKQTKSRSHDHIYEALNSIYYTFNFIKSIHFDTCYDYLILLNYKNVYISRVGIYNGMKNLRKEDFSMEKAARSILMVEYTHPKMTAPILLNIDTGYFIENNEILSPMFIRRALMYQSAPYVFDYSYKLKFMDSNIKSHTIDSHSFVLLKKQGYEIVAI